MPGPPGAAGPEVTHCAESVFVLLLDQDVDSCRAGSAQMCCKMFGFQPPGGELRVVFRKETGLWKL